MHKKTHYLVLALTLILALFMLNGCQEKNQEQTIGEVNGEAITEKQFEQHYRLVLNYYEQTYGKIDEKKEPELVTNLKDSSFEDLVVQKLILQEAKKRGIEADLKKLCFLITFRAISVEFKFMIYHPKTFLFQLVFQNMQQVILYFGNRSTGQTNNMMMLVLISNRQFVTITSSFKHSLIKYIDTSQFFQGPVYSSNTNIRRLFTGFL
jgi:hypothetical protein